LAHDLGQPWATFARQEEAAAVQAEGAAADAKKKLALAQLAAMQVRHARRSRRRSPGKDWRFHSSARNVASIFSKRVVPQRARRCP
jgi:hypothetical protein